MNFLGIDYGQKRIGLSIWHHDVGIVLPLEAIISDQRDEQIARLSEIIRQNSITHLVIGYPINMDGTIGAKAKEVDLFIAALQLVIPEHILIYKSDERLTSETAHSISRTFRSKESPKRKLKNRKRGIIDSQSAVLILQDFINEFPMHKQS